MISADPAIGSDFPVETIWLCRHCGNPKKLHREKAGMFFCSTDTGSLFHPDWPKLSRAQDDAAQWIATIYGFTKAFRVRDLPYWVRCPLHTCEILERKGRLVSWVNGKPGNIKRYFRMVDGGNAK